MSISFPSNTLEKFTTFGDLLRFLRRRMGITQTELAIAVGYSHTQISRLEQNLRLPDIPTIEARFISALDLEEEPTAVARLAGSGCQRTARGCTRAWVVSLQGIELFR